MHERESALREWIKQTIKCDDFTLNPLPGDASFRRYFRLHHQDKSQVIMDAPPVKEDIKPFIHIATVLHKAGVKVPELITINLEQGFLLLDDLGDTSLLNKLNEHTVDFYYKQAMDTLLQIQHCSVNDPLLPSFDKTFMLKEMHLCLDWFFDAYLKINLSEIERDLFKSTMDWLATSVAEQPIVFIHRDYHSRNLMLIEQQQVESIAVIDFQDAMRGPITYDLVSLLKDCYVTWPRVRILDWVTYFYEQHPLASSHYTLPEFVRAFDLCGLQRHLKVLGVFCRLSIRDGKSRYLADLPLTLNYVLECAEFYEELHPLLNLFQSRVFLP
jgi:aminoglycoside/choline kinase family phosphotransferase